MANLHDPGVILMDYLALLKFWHCVDAVFIWANFHLPVALMTCRLSNSRELCSSSWEFLTSLDFEWCVIQGRIPYRPTVWVCK
ncbi:hypothetical protein BC827DRAFT_132253 [Russula dissimulans]|nr:hypothetical protein BC827DRAFT_132253 [Russula dissimulans]